MNRHGTRFIKTQDFISHVNSLNAGFLSRSELEFYERHCLLVPIVRVRWPRTYIVATTERGLGLPVTRPEDLTSPDSLRRLLWRHANGLRPFEAELGHNPLLAAPDCLGFEPWEADETVTVMTPDGHTMRRRRIERYYAPWQAHVVARLRQQKHYDVHSRFLRHIDPEHELWERYRLPEDTEKIRSLRGMATGLDALERYRYADQVALSEAFEGVPAGKPLPEPDRDRLRAVLATWGRQALEMSGVDEAGLFKFISKLMVLMEDYRQDERIALAEDAEQYLLDAQALARDAFDYDWEGFLASSERHGGPWLSAELRRLDPMEAAAQEARENLRAILSQHPVAAIAAGYEGIDAVPGEIAEFCSKHDLWEVLYSLQRYHYTDTEQRRDRFPGFRNRRLRPLALAVEQLTRAILEEAANCSHPTESHSEDCPHGKTLRRLVQVLGRGSAWLPEFERADTGDLPGDDPGALEGRTAKMAAEAADPDTSRDRAIALTLAAAVATRNLVSHRSRFLSTALVMEIGGACADAIAAVWLVARSKGFV